MTAINTNLLSLSGQANLKRSQSALTTAMERLSSGMRINGAKDDAAGQAIGNRMTSQINGRSMAMRNANDGVSLSQTAHGALDQINDKLQRIRELTVQGLNGTLSWSDSDAIQAEINMNLWEIDRLAQSVDYNGIPLLDGSAGLVNLQVGANDNETLKIDLLPPGFSVAALGLEDFTVAGLDGEVTPRNTLQGYARDIELYPQATAETTVSYTGVTGSEPTLRLQSPAEGSFGYYISTLDGDGKPLFFNTGTPQAHHNTASDSSTVTIAATGQLYTDTAPMQARDISSIAFSDSNGMALGGTQRLLQDSGSYVIEQTAANGSVSYHEAELSFAAGSGAVQARMVNDAPSTNQVYSAVSAHVIDGQGYTLSEADHLVFLDSSGMPLASDELFENGGNYYIRSELGGEPAYYRLGSASVSTQLVDDDEELTLTFRASDPRAFLGDDLSSANSVDTLPSLDFTTTDIDFADVNDAAFGGNARLMQRVSNNQYMIEVDSGDGIYRYYQAEVSLTIGPQGEEQVLAKALGEAAATFNLNERVETVSGTSTVTLDPRNVTVNYTDANGDSFSDVLRQRDDGNYYFDLPNSLSNYGSFKVASLVDTEGNDILIKTVNGTGEVIIYYPLDSLAPLSINVSTDANGANDDGIPHTIVNLAEVDQQIRLRTPANPLAALDRAIAIVDSKRSYLGAIENRLGSVVENHISSNLSLSAARSRIMDANYAVEVSNLTRTQILEQAGTSVLAQANQIPQNVLSLLG
ncbi:MULTISPECIES: flagellin [Halomonadaceae]|uniref:flagellin N-terminal helical domain-containing protein n=1 Tax=Halomonadaceae TaxID=28256 RepID=UPI00159A27E3|nr:MULTISPECIES: flagellin [Halomonas]QJQ94074.1 hypothetical protein HIO72_01370 [Halomonas sp. PA5]